MSGPYKGSAVSYQVEDEPLFFGRDDEAHRLTSRVLSSSVTLLHAPSGAGKTSLLNSKIVPSLEKNGWLVIVSRLEDDPSGAIIAKSLLTLCPPVSAEIETVERARCALSLDASAPILELVSAYDDLAIDDPDKSELIRPFEEHEQHEWTEGSQGEAVRSRFSAVLRASAGFDDYFEYLEALQRISDSVSIGPQGLSKQCTIEDLLGYQKKIGGCYAGALKKLTPTSREGRLCELFERVFDILGRELTNLRLVLVLDQFEEIFTNYRDAPARIGRSVHKSNQLNWRLRHQFFDELAALYKRCVSTNQTSATTDSALLPIRFVLGMREEYISHMDVMRRFVPDLDENAYRLNPLTREQASIAITQPAEMYRWSYSDACIREILQELCSEEGYVSPGILQMVCSKLWDHGVSAAESNENRSKSRVIDIDVFNVAVRGVEGIIDDFLDKALEALSEQNRQEALEVLESLITSDRTRNIVSEKEVINAPFRFPGVRRAIVRHLEARGLLRAETRLNRRFIEIAHEILIDPMLRIYRETISGDANYRLLHRGALGALRGVSAIPSPERAVEQISADEFKAAHLFRERINFAWRNPAAGKALGPEIMYRAALKHTDDFDTVAYWARELKLFESGDDEMRIPRWSESGQAISYSEWRKACSLKDVLELDSEQVETMYRTALLRASKNERVEVMYWTTRMAGL